MAVEVYVVADAFTDFVPLFLCQNMVSHEIGRLPGLWWEIFCWRPHGAYSVLVWRAEMQYLLIILLPLFLGLVAAQMGLTPEHWQFWALLGLGSLVAIVLTPKSRSQPTGGNTKKQQPATDEDIFDLLYSKLTPEQQERYKKSLDGTSEAEQRATLDRILKVAVPLVFFLCIGILVVTLLLLPR